jgi:ribose 5-phosphate isomerase A
VDGADEVAPNLDLVKGRGAALVRERIVAAASKRQVILVGSDKLVRRLGERCPIPIEVIPFAAEQVAGRIKELNLVPTLRIDATVRRVITENGNVILDCAVREPLPDGAAARALESAVLSIPGVVDTGLFLGTAERVLVGYADGHVETLSHTGS